ncbi:MAG: hypothetical protein KAR20_15210, partial [Candidatus Heimdallarchaeota archaeon]|nr:hypothetical protein [Candidatus Heimdallarchaeota archaeon]
KDILLSSSTSLGLLYEEFIRSIRKVADTTYKQLTNAFIWGVPAAFLMVRKDIFVCGELYFNADSIVFIPLEEEMAFPNYYLDGTWWISSPIGGLAANALSSQERLRVLKSVCSTALIQMGMSTLQKFIYNIDSVGKAKSGYLHIFKNKIDDVYLDSSAIFVKSSGGIIMFGSTAVYYTQQESRENIAKWKSGDYETIGKTRHISETIAPKILLDNVLKGRVYSNQEIDNFLRNEVDRHTLYSLYKGLTPQMKTTFQERAQDNAPQLLEPLKDMGYMDSLETLGEKGCFIASVAFSDYDAPQVIVLRRYRDETLVRTRFGRCFIRRYYRHGPSLAALLKRHRMLKNVVAWALNIIVWFIVASRKGLGRAEKN